MVKLVQGVSAATTEDKVRQVRAAAGVLRLRQQFDIQALQRRLSKAPVVRALTASVADGACLQLWRDRKSSWCALFGRAREVEEHCESVSSARRSGGCWQCGRAGSVRAASCRVGLEEQTTSRASARA